MYMRVKSSKLSPRKTVQIVKSVRSGKRVTQIIVQHVGVAQNEEHLEELKLLAQKLMKEIEDWESPPIPGLYYNIGQIDKREKERSLSTCQ
jgi:hypothetical protein